MVTSTQCAGESWSSWLEVAATAFSHQASKNSFPTCPLLMMLFDGVLRPVITHSWKQSFHPLSFNDQQQGCLGLRELVVKGGEEKKKKKKQLSKSRELKWTPLEKIYFRIKRLMLGFHFVTAMGCGNKCQRAGGDLQRPSPITENYLLLPKVVFEPSGLHLRCDWIMAVWHTPLMELSHRYCRAAWAVAFCCLGWRWFPWLL